MSANWKNPFLQQKQERDDLRIQDDECVKKMKKDMRVSCEAIPEEIAGMGEYFFLSGLIEIIKLQYFRYNTAY